MLVARNTSLRQPIFGSCKMKYAFSCFMVCLAMTIFAADSNAVVCASGPYRAGCVGVRGGAAVVRHPYVARRGVMSTAGSIDDSTAAYFAVCGLKKPAV